MKREAEDVESATSRIGSIKFYLGEYQIGEV